MKLRETTKCRHRKRLARRVANLEAQLAAVLQRVDKLEQENARLREESTRLRDENAQLKQQLAAARAEVVRVATIRAPPLSYGQAITKPPRFSSGSSLETTLVPAREKRPHAGRPMSPPNSSA